MSLANAGKSKVKKAHQYIGLAYIAPWLIGFLTLQLYPFLISFWYSLTDLNLFREPRFIGLDNFIQMFTANADFWQSFRVTFIYVLAAVPAKIAFALIVAMIMNQKLRGINFFRTVYYLPSILGGSVALAILWKLLFMSEGVVNHYLSFLGIPGHNWLGDPGMALTTISLLQVWQFGSSMVLFLAGLKQIPAELYEAGRVDGASRLRMFFHITIPQLTPIILFNLIMQMVNAFQEFTAAFVITNGGPLKSTYLYGYMIYQYGFDYLKMGYASALSWVLFIVIMIFTVVIFKSSSMWVHYEDAGDF
ncbi:oligogalacturonide transport system permease protein [Hydrogenispora ethanolica]|uniref:Oligogalacturonide transport system permease protein n=1 Tax=Hydrogenispora ethanolica TaxID=1082276 RepID=A0A4R1RTZ4_HYDET|nr:sugar ABC transporter permease [Hydrogenispora ethanolica]TCL70023.1 oligogalacturonide transport system permease protein [Hydrogenispora ethanolica]